MGEAGGDGGRLGETGGGWGRRGETGVDGGSWGRLGETGGGRAGDGGVPCGMPVRCTTESGGEVLAREGKNKAMKKSVKSLCLKAVKSVRSLGV